MDLNNQPNQSPSSPRPPAPEEPAQKQGVGAVVGTIIIILLLALGAFYFWGASLNGGQENPPPYILGNEATNAESDSQAGLPPQSSSDESDDIYADVQAMNIERLESENSRSAQSFNASAQ